ncbi:hypothetical protein V7S43_008273 [Phytophthora oleae]|uniref:Uncharacterized protein n=1 Tax=Phytophthora oleae TaxID=2107226 RepID=A0ABD3FIS1_9STRA
MEIQHIQKKEHKREDELWWDLFGDPVVEDQRGVASEESGVGNDEDEDESTSTDESEGLGYDTYTSTRARPTLMTRFLISLRGGPLMLTQTRTLMTHIRTGVGNSLLTSPLTVISMSFVL